MRTNVGKISLVLVILSLTAMVFADTADKESGDFTFVEKAGKITITKYNGKGGKVKIPAKIEGKDVVAIGEDAFSGCDRLTKITIPNSVKRIEGGAFLNCDGLTSITIPDNVESIKGCAFAGCRGLTKIIIPNRVKSIEYEAFGGCTGLINISISNGVKSIESGAFDGCIGLTNITIPDSVTHIGRGAFRDCVRLTQINVSGNNVKYSSIEGVLFTKDKSTLIQCPMGKKSDKYTIPNSVKKIGEYAFLRCKELTNIIIPDSVKSIGERAFSGCTGLKKVIIPNNVTSIGADAFSGNDNLIIHGRAGSIVERYANINRLPFEVIP